MEGRARLGRGGHSPELFKFAFTLQHAFAHLSEQIDRDNALELRRHRVRSWRELVKLPPATGPAREFTRDGPGGEWGLTLRLVPFSLPACLRCEDLAELCQRRLRWAPLFVEPRMVGGPREMGLILLVEARHLGEPPLQSTNETAAARGARPWLACLPLR